MTAPQIRVASAQSTVRTAVARALATALVTGIDNCAEEGRPLSQLQQIDLAVSHVMAYQEAMDGCEAVEVDAELGQIISEATANAVARNGAGPGALAYYDWCSDQGIKLLLWQREAAAAILDGFPAQMAGRMTGKTALFKTLECFLNDRFTSTHGRLRSGRLREGSFLADTRSGGES